MFLREFAPPQNTHAPASDKHFRGFGKRECFFLGAILPESKAGFSRLPPIFSITTKKRRA